MQHLHSANALEIRQSCTKPSIWYCTQHTNDSGRTPITFWNHDARYHISPRTCYHIEARQNGRHFPDDIFKSIFLNKNVWFSIKVSLKFVPKGPINNIPTLVQIMAWRRSGDKPLSEPIMINLLKHKCVTRSQCDKQGSGAPNIDWVLPFQNTYISSKTHGQNLQQKLLISNYCFFLSQHLPRYNVMVTNTIRANQMLNCVRKNTMAIQMSTKVGRMLNKK